MPLNNGTVSYNGNWNNSQFNQTAGWYERLNSGDSYRLTAGTRSGGGDNLSTQASAWYSHNSDLADVTASMSWQQNNYTAGAVSMRGGLTATTKGAALHGGSSMGGTRMMVSTDGVGGVPVGRNGRSNAFGIAVEPSLSSYYRNTVEIDVTRLPEDVEAAGSPVAEAALTEGAIGFRHFDILKGSKVVAILKRADGSSPPFGASIRNKKGRELGMVSDGGLAWISGVSPTEMLAIFWEGRQQCTVSLPDVIPEGQLLLPCEVSKQSLSD